MHSLSHCLRTPICTGRSRWCCAFAGQEDAYWAPKGCGLRQHNCTGQRRQGGEELLLPLPAPKSFGAAAFSCTAPAQEHAVRGVSTTTALSLNTNDRPCHSAPAHWLHECMFTSAAHLVLGAALLCARLCRVVHTESSPAATAGEGKQLAQGAGRQAHRLAGRWRLCAGVQVSALYDAALLSKLIVCLCELQSLAVPRAGLLASALPSSH